MNRIAILAAAAAVVTATPALAQSLAPKVTQASATIDLRNLDLTTEAGADALIVRVEETALRLCGSGPGVGVLAQQAAINAAVCRRNAVAAALAKVNAPVVRQRYAARHQAEIRLAGR